MAPAFYVFRKVDCTRLVRRCTVMQNPAWQRRIFAIRVLGNSEFRRLLFAHRVASICTILRCARYHRRYSSIVSARRLGNCLGLLFDRFSSGSDRGQHRDRSSRVAEPVAECIVVLLTPRCSLALPHSTRVRTPRPWVKVDALAIGVALVSGHCLTPKAQDLNSYSRSPRRASHRSRGPVSRPSTLHSASRPSIAWVPSR